MSNKRDNRDNFSKETVHIAAKRVGYRCSFPGCPVATIGPSMEGPRKVSSNGVAAHICAAAPGGKRYDANMSTEERKGVENCIWMCQTHAHLIDTDDITYTAEKLRRWKADAEEAAAKELANVDFISEYYKNNGDNLDILAQIFDDMIIDGQYNQLGTMLQQYNVPLSELYEEFVLRYKIIYDIYCSRETLSTHIKTYCGLPSKAGADILAKYFIAFQLVDELKDIINFCISPDIKSFALLAISGELKSRLIIPVGSTPSIEISNEMSTTVAKYVVNYIRSNMLVGAVDTSGNAYPLYMDEFYYRAISSAHNIADMTVYGNGDFDRITGSTEFSFISESIAKIKLLDTSLQEYIWEKLLAFLSVNYDEFNKLYHQCPSELKKYISIQRVVFICQINHNIDSVDIDELIDYQNKIGNYSTLYMYLSFLKKDAANLFLDEHSYLYKKDSLFLRLKCDLAYDTCSEDKYRFLSEYEALYEDNFTFQLLMAECTPDVLQKNERIEWLCGNRYKANNHDLVPYISLLRDNQMWDELIYLPKLHLPNECLFQIASCLAQSGNSDYEQVSINIYQDLITCGWERQWIRYNMGCIQYRQSLVEDAKNSFRDEYDRFHSIPALKKLEALRIETCEFVEDEYLDGLKNCIDAQSQNWVAAIYLKLQNRHAAKKYFLRSLLLNDSENMSLNGFWQVASTFPEESPTNIKSDTVSILKNKQKTIQIAIHSTDVLDGITSPNEFANCSHYSVEDITVSVLLYHKEGDDVSFLGNDYTVETILSSDSAFIKYFFSSLSDRKGVTAIYGTSAEDLMNNILPILKDSSESLEKTICDYSQLEIRYPLSVLASKVGKKMLAACEFLAYGNKIKIINNLRVLDELNNNSTFILSYDTIVLLVHLNIDLEKIKKKKVLCPRQVKNQLISDISEELSTLSDDKQTATMFYDDGRINLVERSDDYRRERSAFLIRLKSFVNSLDSTEESHDYTPKDPDIKKVFDALSSKQKMYCETGTLELAKQVNNGVLITDDQFLYAVASTDGICSTGLIGLIISICANWEELLDFSKQLQRINFANYLPFSLYKQMVNLLIDSDTDLDRGSIEIQEWLLSDTNEEPSEYHEDVILALAHDVITSKDAYLNPGNIFEDITVTILEKRNPGILQKYMSIVRDIHKQSVEE